MMLSKTIFALSTALLLSTAPVLAQDNEYEGHVRYPVKRTVASPSATFAQVRSHRASRFTAAEQARFKRVERPGY
jgi:hypothetical protein